MLCFKHFAHVCVVSLTPIIRLFEKDGMKINEELFAQAHQAMQVLRQPLKLKQVVELTSVIVIYRI